MKYIKILGLAAVAAMALMAFVGASSASATVLCKVSTSPCPTGSMYEPGTVIEGVSTNATLTSDLATVVCTNSETVAKTETTGSSTTTVTGTITALTFTGCTANNGTVKCTVTVQGLPYHAEVHWGSGVNGTLTVKAHAGGVSPGATVVCAGLISCTFENTLFTLPVNGGNPATIVANAVPLERTAFGGTPLCGTTAAWDATYTAVGTNTSINVLSQ
jgi:hypothetical protein